MKIVHYFPTYLQPFLLMSSHTVMETIKIDQVSANSIFNDESNGKEKQKTNGFDDFNQTTEKVLL